METIEISKVTEKVLLEDIAEYSNNINDALNMSGFSIDEWYFAFTISEDYQNLDAKKRKEIFLHFTNFKYIIKQLDDYCWHNKLGIYKN